MHMDQKLQQCVEEWEKTLRHADMLQDTKIDFDVERRYIMTLKKKSSTGVS